MGMEEFLAAMGGGHGIDDDDKETDLAKVRAALERPKLTGLVFGDLIKGVKLGKDFRTKSEDKPAIFVRYLTDAEKVAYNAPHGPGCPILDADIVLSHFIDKADGEPVLFAMDSAFYERV